MINVEWRTHVDLDDVFRLALEQRIREIGIELDQVRCPVHGTAPTIVVTGQSAESINAGVESCCEELGRLARAKLAEMGFEDDGQPNA